MLLPKEFIENSIESYIHKHTTRSQAIYLAALLAVSAILIALPWVYVDVTVQNPGMIRPMNERTELRSAVAEVIDSVYVREGDIVHRGDTMLRLRTDNLHARQLLTTHKLDDVRRQMIDLELLVQGYTPQRFASGVRMQEYAYYIRRKKELETALDKSRSEYTRNRQLYDKEVIAAEEYEQYLYALRKAENEASSLETNQLSVWQTDLNTLTATRAELESTLEQLRRERELHYIISPVDGTLEQFAGIYRGNSVAAGQTLGIISPDSTLYAEVYVSPRNIGYLHEAMTVNIQIESFDYNEWGTVAGAITNISSDFYIDENSRTSYYKVKCRLDRNFLELKNGRRGMLKKGMTVYAHFVLTRRSLFDLLYQKIDQWINPTQYRP